MTKIVIGSEKHTKPHGVLSAVLPLHTSPLVNRQPSTGRAMLLSAQATPLYGAWMQPVFPQTFDRFFKVYTFVSAWTRTWRRSYLGTRAVAGPGGFTHVACSFGVRSEWRSFACGRWPQWSSLDSRVGRDYFANQVECGIKASSARSWTRSQASAHWTVECPSVILCGYVSRFPPSLWRIGGECLSFAGEDLGAFDHLCKMPLSSMHLWWGRRPSPSTRASLHAHQSTVAKSHDEYQWSRWIRYLDSTQHSADFDEALMKFRDVFYEHGLGARRLCCRDTLLMDPGRIKLLLDLYGKLDPNRHIGKMEYPRPRDRVVEAWQRDLGPYCFVMQGAQWASKLFLGRPMIFTVDDIRIEMKVLRHDWPQIDLAGFATIPMIAVIYRWVCAEVLKMSKLSKRSSQSDTHIPCPGRMGEHLLVNNHLQGRRPSEWIVAAWKNDRLIEVKVNSTYSED